MQFTIDRQTLLTEVALLQGVLEKKRSVTTLSNILIKAEVDKVILTASDLDDILIVELEADVSEIGAGCVNGVKFHNVLRSLDAEEVKITCGDDFKMHIQAGKPKVQLLGIDPGRYPNLPTFQEPTHTVMSAALRTLLKKGIYAISENTQRYTISGANLLIKDSLIRVVSTDTHRLVFAEYSDPADHYGSELNIILRHKTIKELAKISLGDTLNIGADNNHLYFQHENRILMSRLLTGTFPAYEMLIPKDADLVTKIPVSGMTLKKSVSRATLLADATSSVIKIRFDTGNLYVSGESRDAGFLEDSIPIEYSGDPFTISLSANYLYEFLNRIQDGNDIIWNFTSKSAMVVLKEDTTDYEFKVIFSPLRA